MHLKKMLFVVTNLLCICSLSLAQDFSLSQIQLNGVNQFGSDAVTAPTGANLPSGIFGESKEPLAAAVNSVEEEAYVQRVNGLILMGISGLFLAGLSGAGLLYTYRRKSKNHSPGVQAIGI